MENNNQLPMYYVPYKKHGEPDRKAVVVGVDFDTEGLSHDDLQLLGNLSEAVDRINPIFRDQFEDSTTDIKKLIQSLIPYAENKEEFNELNNYLTMLDIQNSPFETTTRKNHLLGLERKILNELIEKNPDRFRLKKILDSVEPFLYDPLTLSKKAEFYPEDMTEREFEGLGRDGLIINSGIKRTHEGLKGIINEEKYKGTLAPIINLLEKSKSFSGNEKFRNYLDKKINELRTGSAESRTESDLAWIKNDSNIDFIISTALEVYLDGWKGIRGAALGNIMVVDKSSEVLLERILEQLPALEANAPWKLKKHKEYRRLPHLKSVNVLNRSGDYVKGCGVVVAQSLPNEDSIVENYGSVNLIYKNVARARHNVLTSREAEEFLPKEILDKYKNTLFDSEEIHFALHELGHTTGSLDDKFAGREANEILQEEYSVIEESRAELFTLYALPHLINKGVISKPQAEATYYEFLLDLVADLKYEPKQTHQRARNIIYHYFTEKDAIKTKREGKTQFSIDPDRINQAACELLAVVGDIKSYGRKDKAAELGDKYCFTDTLKEEIEERTKDFPVGIGIIFPRLVRRNGIYTPELEYPKSFSEQQAYQYSLL